MPPLSLLRRGVVWDEPRLNTQNAGRQAADFSASNTRSALAGLVAAGLQWVEPRLTLSVQNRVVTNEGPPARQVPYVSRVLNLLDARRGARVADLAMDRGFGSSRTGYR
jgi:hypothetical protein